MSHVYFKFPVRVPHVPIANLLRDCLRELGSPTDSDDPSDMASEVFLVGVIAAVLETDEYTAEIMIPFVAAAAAAAANRVLALRIAAEPTQPNQRSRMPTLATKSLSIGTAMDKRRKPIPLSSLSAPFKFCSSCHAAGFMMEKTGQLRCQQRFRPLFQKVTWTPAAQGLAALGLAALARPAHIPSPSRSLTPELDLKGTC
jgi:hypothetical protein